MTSISVCRCRRPIPGSTGRKVVADCRIPDDRPLSENESGWIELLRVLAGDRDPPVTLAAVEVLRRALMGE